VAFSLPAEGAAEGGGGGHGEGDAGTARDAAARAVAARRAEEERRAARRAAARDIVAHIQARAPHPGVLTGCGPERRERGKGLKVAERAAAWNQRERRAKDPNGVHPGMHRGTATADTKDPPHTHTHSY
jgi:hypothetical protein